MNRFLVGCALALSVIATGSVHGDEAGHYSAARKLVETSLPLATAEELSPMMGPLGQLVPELAGHKDAFLQFITEIFNSEPYRDAYARMYMDLYTEKELRRLNKLMQDPVYQKMLAVRAEQGRRRIELIVSQMKQNIGLFKELIRAESPAAPE